MDGLAAPMTRGARPGRGHRSRRGRWAGGFVRAHVHLLAVAVGALSLLSTAHALVFGAAVLPGGAGFGGPGSPFTYPAVAELGLLYVLLAAVARWTVPIGAAAVSGAVPWVASVLWILGVTQESDPFIVLSGVVASAVFPTLAVAVGAVPRYLVHRRAELIVAVRREQRLELAQDLHDFVAHDLTGIVAQAQAARFARAEDADHLRGALARIEDVGVAALETMDGFVQVLNSGEAAPRSMRRIEDVPALAERFRAERAAGAPVRVEVDDDLCSRSTRRAQATAYRVVVEGLTNVRRHAAPQSPVTVSVGAASGGGLRVVVLNGAGPSPVHGLRPGSGGTGLTALRERVRAVGGRLEAGPDGAGRWRLEATLPGADGAGAPS